MCARTASAWNGVSGTVRISSSKTSNRGPRFAWSCPSFRPLTPTIGSSSGRGLAIRTITSTFGTTCYLNGHHYIAGELQRAGIRFRRDDNAFLAIDDLNALQAAADRLSPAIIRKRLDYWTRVLGPTFSPTDRTAINLRREYSLNQIEYCESVPRNRFAVMCPPRICGHWRVERPFPEEILSFR